MANPLQFLIGLFVVLLPGLTATWALAPRLDWAKFVAISVIVGLSVGPATIYVLGVFFGVDFTPLNMVLICLFLSSLFLAIGLRPRLHPENR